ncbi:ORC1-type DNA replication protein, partial [Candidatus Woesearchaeota archaeon]|nr:ORC1-type DNA replication protein [Candidatus Woesearchaeota archaeon]
EKGLANYFEQFLAKQPLFKNKKSLQSNYTPETINHRDPQIKQVADILAPVLRNEKPSNIFIYGKTGTGKTLCTKYICGHISHVASQKEFPLKIIYLNCKLKKVADTEYRLIAQLAREFGKAIPPTGLPTDEVYSIFFKAVDQNAQSIILILDEIDQLINKIGDEVLYNLTRMNETLKKSQVCLVGISNNLIFTEHLDPRVKSSLSEEEILFPPYNALQIQNILRQRVNEAFHKGAIESGVIEKCAAYAAKEHGDARRALELLRVAGELAERESSAKVTMHHIDTADKKIEQDRIFDVLASQPKQFQATLYSVLLISQKKKGAIFTGEIYEVYKKICQRANLLSLTQRRVSDIIAEMDMLGLINAKVISKGRYGRTREITLSVPLSVNPQVKKQLEEGLDLS